jgi:hypothetical protein
MALALCALTLTAAASPSSSKYVTSQFSSSPHPIQLIAPRSRDSDPADRNPFGLPYAYEGHKRVYRTDILRETGQQPKWLQEKEAARKRMGNLGLGREEERAGYVHFVGGSPSSRHPQGGSQSAVSAIRETATSSAKVAVKAGKGVIRSAKGALRKGFCFLKNC